MQNDDTHTTGNTVIAMTANQIYYFLKKQSLKLRCILSKRIHTTYWHQETAGL